ncbi:MAG: hypothetical protein MUF83_23390 [Acidimicrobiales bacterium]|jgi:hypothetical protein|nr:hypothetical protein [Acidimicrobiales bacterium]
MVLDLHDFDRDQLAVLCREYLLAGHLIDRAGMPHLVGDYGREPMRDIAIDEWMGASPVYTRRMQRALGYEGDDVETIFKGLQLDVGSPPQFMDFRMRVDGPDRGEFWLDHCGALMDVEPMGEDYVFAMCHDIEDPTFDATALATNPRAAVRPVHRPPRVPADRHPHCHWTVTIDPATEPVVQSALTDRIAATRAASVVLPARDHHDGDGLPDYHRPFDPDLWLEDFSRGALLTIADEVCLQGHLLVMSFVAAVADRYGDGDARAIGRKQFIGVAGVAARRLARCLSLEPGDDAETLDAIATVVSLHPGLRPHPYVDVRVEHGERLVVVLGACDAIAEEGLYNWIDVLAAGDAAPLDAIVQAVDARARCVAAEAPAGALAAWEVVLGHDRAAKPAEVVLTEFSTGADFVFRPRPTA